MDHKCGRKKVQALGIAQINALVYHRCSYGTVTIYIAVARQVFRVTERVLLPMRTVMTCLLLAAHVMIYLYKYVLELQHPKL